MSALESVTIEKQSSVREGKKRELNTAEQDKKYLTLVEGDKISVSNNERFASGLKSSNEDEYIKKKTITDIRPFKFPSTLSTIPSEGEVPNSRSLETQDTRKSKVMRVASTVTDFIPVIGSIKMIAESFRGKQYGTDKEIKGWGRFLHGASGMAFLALDVTGVGAVASEIGKGILKISERMAMKAVERKASQEILKREAEQLFIRGKERSKRAEEM